MAFNLADQYFVKALEMYDYNLEEVVENLNYSLSYDPEHPAANELMGRMYMDQFGELEKAKVYLDEAMAADLSNLQVCESITRWHIKMRAYKDALLVISYASGLPGAQMDQWIRMEALIYELCKEYAKAMDLLKRALDESVSSEYSYFLKGELNRVCSKHRNTLAFNYNYNG
ncbi:tetratricopeptide repeat protein [Ekhidna sp.]|uniref:tetratricopeptide repeat protein n=1 Tax=Ekhidna sp. TaxID=2608089 RepID=UPI003B501807